MADKPTRHETMRPSVPYEDIRRVGPRDAPIPGFTPEQLSVIRHIAEIAAVTVAEKSSAGIYTDASERADRKVKQGTRRARTREGIAWVSLLAAIATFATAQLRSCANEIELRAATEPTVTIPIPVAPSTGPTAEQVTDQAKELAELRSAIANLLAAEQARAESDAAKRRPKVKAKP